MLRASAHAAGESFDLRAITDRTVDPRLAVGAELLAFVDALMSHDASLGATSVALTEAAGPDALVRAAAVAGNFQMMNRLVDATGVPIGATQRAIAINLGLD